MSVAGKVGAILITGMYWVGPDSAVVEFDAGNAHGARSTFEVWSLVTIRKVHPCVACGSNLRPRDRALRPMTEAPHRHHRLCTPCVDSHTPVPYSM